MKSARARDLLPIALLTLVLGPRPGHLAVAQSDEPVAHLSEVDALAASDVYLAVTVRSDFSPYHHVRYELKSRGSTVIAVATKQLVGGYGELQGLGLVPDDAFAGVVASLNACRIDELEPPTDTIHSAPEPPGLMTYELEIRLDQYARHAVREGAELGLTEPFWCAVSLLMETYREYGEPIPFENTFFDEGEFGLLTVDSVPRAQVFIDGNDTGRTTPIHQLRLAAGVHFVRFVNQEQGIDREYDATIEEGHTTRLDIELR